MPPMPWCWMILAICSWEARLALEWLDEALLAEHLSQHIALLERLEPQLTEAALAPQWRQMIWHP